MAEYFVALYDYQATTSNGLGLRRGETVVVREKNTTGWCMGEASQGFGWFPETYVAKQEGEPVPLGWQVCTDDAGRVYYVNLATQQTSWTKPTAASRPAAAAAGSAVTPLSATVSPSTMQLLAQPPPARSSSVEDLAALAAAEQAPPQKEIPVVQVEGKEFAVDPNGKITFADNFWADKDAATTGFDVLVNKHRNGKDVLKEVAEWMRERASVEERYARELLRLAKSPLADIEEGTMKTAWNQVKFDLDNQHRIRGGLAADLLELVEKPLIDFKDRQKKKRKDFEATIAKDRKNMALKEEAVERARKLYMQRMKDADAAEQLANRGDRREQAKVDAAKGERKKATQAGLDYKRAVEDYESVRRQWEDDMNLACLDFQEAEEERILTLRQILEAYLDAEKKVRERLTSSAEMVRTSVQAVSTEVDIEMFVKARGTGARKPPTVSFRQYGSK